MKSNYQKVRDFMQAFGQELPNKHGFPNQDVVLLRYNLIHEELEELNQAMQENDIVEVADALVDILYVTYGALAAFGLPANALFDEVHRSNMSKLGEDGNPIYREDGKVIKGPNYSEPDIKSVVENYGKWWEIMSKFKFELNDN